MGNINGKNLKENSICHTTIELKNDGL